MNPFLQSLVAAGLLIGVGASALSTAGSDPAGQHPPDRRPAYLGSARCVECHADAYAAWRDSHHGWAWRPATANNVLANFADTTFEHRGVRSRFFRRDERYFVETGDANGDAATYEITGTVGVTPLQQYLVALDDGRLQALDVVWDTERGRWYPLYPDQALEGDPGLHWTGPYKNWNSRCVNCHVTGFVKGYEPKTNRYRSSWREMGVGCEACHGPAEAHVAWAEHPESATPGRFDGIDAQGLAVTFKGKAAEQEIQVCAGCHSRRESLGADSAPPGEPFADHYRLALLREGLYHADGQIEDEVYVYGSFLQSGMYASGVRCTHCHEPHGTKLVADVNTVCTQCHNPAGRADFPSLVPATYDSPLHHHHPAGSEAAHCVSCHMPARTYMGVDPRRDHSFRVPRPDLSLKLGVPNACTGCHTDRSSAWAHQHVVAWFPQSRHRQPHYGEILHAGRERLDEATVAGLIDLALTSDAPAIVRASALELLVPAASPAIAAKALPLLKAPDPLVRSATLGLFNAAPAVARTKYCGPLLEDPVRSVRIAAAQRILDIPTDNLSPSDQAIVKTAVDEYQASLEVHADFPEVQLNIARVAERLGNRQMMQQSLQAAIALDPKLAEAWLRLAQLQIQTRRFDAAKQTLERAVTEVTGSAALHQLLGRVLVGLKDETAAVRAFARALQTQPQALEIRIEYVSLLSRLDKYAEAIAALEDMDEVARLEPQVLYLLAFNHAQMKNMTKARYFANELARHHPGHSLSRHIRSFVSQD